MDNTLIYILLVFVAFIAYKKYAQYKVLKLVPSLLKEGALIIDVRSVDEFAIANKKGSINIPITSINEKISQVDKNKPIILCCASGSRSAIAKRVFISKGFKNVHNAGSWHALRKF
ncbi:rhodanese-like domain-containing protein [Arcobacter peruensis]|uniref:rhodanese-like domain-containing protein n=1 Tax=Arcobacter peruensis TaxID=2320140 RepID=UPI000F09954A|nr:rhodanese-like domain-containing protein [Arcobacter peruensis]